MRVDCETVSTKTKDNRQKTKQKVDKPQENSHGCATEKNNSYFLKSYQIATNIRDKRNLRRMPSDIEHTQAVDGRNMTAQHLERHDERVRREVVVHHAVEHVNRCVVARSRKQLNK